MVVPAPFDTVGRVAALVRGEGTHDKCNLILQSNLIALLELPHVFVCPRMDAGASDKT